MRGRNYSRWARSPFWRCTRHSEEKETIVIEYSITMTKLHRWAITVLMTIVIAGCEDQACTWLRDPHFTPPAVVLYVVG